MPVFLLLLAACAVVSPRYPGPLGPVGKHYEPRERRSEPPPEAVVRKAPPRETDPIVAAAEHYLKHRPSGFRDDCSGFVCAVFDRAGLPLEGNTELLWERARSARAVHRRRLPHAGDIAFFDHTYDRNGNGRLDDELTHVAVVLRVDADGTILMAHRGSSKGRSTLVMNLQQPGVRHDESGKELNDYLRVQRASDPAGTRYLAGELWRGFATVRQQDLPIWLGETES